MSWWAIAGNDLRGEMRSRSTLVPLLVLALLVGAVGALAFHDAHDPTLVASAVVWTALAFASSLGLARAFGQERDRGTLDTLLALPYGRIALFAGKTAASLALLLATLLVVVPAYALASGAPVLSPGFLAFLVLGCVGLAATGTMLSALAAQTRARDLLLPVLLLPLVVPLLIAAIHGSQDALQGAPFDEWRPELLLLVGYDVAFLAAGALLMEQAVGA